MTGYRNAQKPDWRTGLPYRPNVGICLINRNGLIWVGRAATSGPEIVTPGLEWQMPQGGIEENEDILVAAKRELLEETGISSISFLAQTYEWWAYDFTPDYTPKNHKLDRFCGQKQKWVAFRYDGNENEIDISAQGTIEPQEFFEWQWFSPDEAISKCVRMKRKQYERVFKAFSSHFAPI